MQKILLVVALLSGGYFGTQKLLPTMMFDPLEYKGEQTVTDEIMYFEWEEFNAEGAKLELLAEKNTITVVDFYSSSCSLCKSLTDDFKDLLDIRDDVYVKRIVLPENDGKTLSEAEAARFMKESEEMKRKLKKLKVCGTPHVTIFKPDGKMLIQDICQNRRGTKYLKEWVDKEYENEEPEA